MEDVWWSFTKVHFGRYGSPSVSFAGCPATGPEHLSLRPRTMDSGEVIEPAAFFPFLHGRNLNFLLPAISITTPDPNSRQTNTAAVRQSGIANSGYLIGKVRDLHSYLTAALIDTCTLIHMCPALSVQFAKPHTTGNALAPIQASDFLTQIGKGPLE